MEQNMRLRFQNRSAASQEPADGLSDDAGGQQEAARSLRALLVLDHLARAQHPPTLAQLAQRLDMPKTTLMRLLAAMQRAGFVAATPTENGFVPGPQATSLALATLRACAIRQPRWRAIGPVSKSVFACSRLRAWILHGARRDQ